MSYFLPWNGSARMSAERLARAERISASSLRLSKLSHHCCASMMPFKSALVALGFCQPNLPSWQSILRWFFHISAVNTDMKPILLTIRPGRRYWRHPSSPSIIGDSFCWYRNQLWHQWCRLLLTSSESRTWLTWAKVWRWKEFWWFQLIEQCLPTLR